jgi:hypothetical protein
MKQPIRERQLSNGELWLDVVCPVPGCECDGTGPFTVAGINATRAAASIDQPPKTLQQCRDWLAEAYTEHIGQAH